MTNYVPPFPPQNYVDKKGPVVGAAWLNAIDQILQGNVPATGQYQAPFLSGQVQVTGPGGLLTSYGDLTFGLAIPSPAGTNIPALIVGGAGKQSSMITVDAQIPGMNGMNLFLVAGSSDPAGSNDAGSIEMFGGGSVFGFGGQVLVQGGTSVHGHGGNLFLQGGNSTDGPAGNVYIVAGTNGNQGGEVKIYSTSFGGGAGDISFWLGQPDTPHSIPLWTMSHTGALFPGNQGAGSAPDLINMIVGSTLITGGNLASPTWDIQGLSGIIPLTLSGAIQTPITGNFYFTTNGRQVTLTCLTPVIGNSTGPNDLILSTLPVGLKPNIVSSCVCSGLFNDNNIDCIGKATVSGGGVVISLMKIVSNIPFFQQNQWALTNKGVTAQWSITYPLQ